MMNSLIAATFSYVYSWYKYFRGTWALNFIYGKKLPSKETTETVYKSLNILTGTTEGESKDVCSLLDSLSQEEEILHIVDDLCGYDLLQNAVIRGWKDVVETLLKYSSGSSSYSCSPPLHLAALLGNVGILKLLLDHEKAKNVSRGMCYPQSHSPILYRNALFGFTRQPVYYCQKNSFTPIECAIGENHVDCMKLILNHFEENGKAATSRIVLFHYACREGAAECIKYLVSKFPELINDYNSEGDTPLLTAVPWGRECVKILVDSGADVHLVSKKIQETALHRLYRMSIDGLFSIYDTTKYLLTTGIEQDINSLTSLGESPLHMLVSHVSYTGGNYVNQNLRRVPRSSLQEDYQQQVLDALKLLMNFNADPSLLNGYGLQSLSRMLHIALKACNNDNPCGCVQTSIFTYLIKDYKNDYGALAQAMQILLHHGADANFQCHLGHSPLVLLLQCLLYDDVIELCVQAQDVVMAFKVLLKSAANLNFVAGNQGTCSTLLAMICQRYFSLDNNNSSLLHTAYTNRISMLHSGPVGEDTDVRMEFAELTNQVLNVFLNYGLDANHTSSKMSPYLRGGTGNALIEFVRLTELAKSTKDFTVIHMWLRTLLQWGANPDIEPYPSEPIICHSQSSIFLKKQGTQAVSHYIHEVKERESLFTDGRAQDLLLLFYNSMNHDILYECLNAAKSMARFHPIDSNGRDFLSLINVLSENPRSLKQIARVSIYKALDRQLKLKVDLLPLPVALKRFLLEIY